MILREEREKKAVEVRKSEGERRIVERSDSKDRIRED